MFNLVIVNMDAEQAMRRKIMIFSSMAVYSSFRRLSIKPVIRPVALLEIDDPDPRICIPAIVFTLCRFNGVIPNLDKIHSFRDNHVGSGVEARNTFALRVSVRDGSELFESDPLHAEEDSGCLLRHVDGRVPRFLILRNGDNFLKRFISTGLVLNSAPSSGTCFDGPPCLPYPKNVSGFVLAAGRLLVLEEVIK